jgi:hypothetical protein
MAVIIHLHAPEWTQEHYDQLAREVTPERKLPAGCLVHIAGPLPGGGWQVIDVWESREACDRFTEQKIMPAAQRLGIPQPASAPQVVEAHTFMKA